MDKRDQVGALGHDWAIVLAGGSGLRLQSLTTGPDGRSVPKQYCSLQGDRTLLGGAIARAGRIVDPERLIAVVAAEHRRFWEPEFVPLVSDNVVVQPRNRGTASGILLPLLSVVERDPSARVVLLPSDHHVESEALLAVTLLGALQSVASDSMRVTLLGITPNAATSDYGWIMPVAGASRLRAVDRFIEKPETDLARLLMCSGALWNSFIMVGRAAAFLQLYLNRQPALLTALAEAFLQPPAEVAATLSALYRTLPSSDFSRDVLQGSESRLDVLEVPPCGWTDLGTPERVAECLLNSDSGPIPASGSGRIFPVLRTAIERHEAAPSVHTSRESVCAWRCGRPAPVP
jgi:mannose-1-phosphate guanylyltransferase